MDIQGRLNQANGPRPNSQKKEAFQQRLVLGVHFNPAGISLAEQEARKVGVLLDCQEFSWEPYLQNKSNQSQPLAGDWIAQFQEHYFARRAHTPKSQTTWHKDYWAVLKHLPQDQPLTPEILTAAILSTKPDTKTRKRFCTALQALARFAAIEFDGKLMTGNYSPKRVTPRDLPDDRLIADWFDRIRNPAWRWAYGIIATFGLRPHEIFYLDTSDLEAGGCILTILEGGKTKPRRVWPCYPEWVDVFDLRSPIIPSVTGRNNSELGERCSQYFRRNAGLPFKLYDLRRCWAIRTLEFGLDISLSAQQMGHSVQVHTELYHQWISDRHHQRAFEALMMRSDHPLPPLTNQPTSTARGLPLQG